MATPEEARGSVLALSVAALGVVYGDIGTSPLYAIRECFLGPHGVGVSRENVFGVLSLVFWALVIVVSVKYLAFILRADNRGEGGILALLALAHPEHRGRRATGFLLLIGLFSAALLYGDGMLTPAISVLSAVEGLNVATHALERYVLPTTVVILVGFFLVQRYGTARVGSVFGPITFLWFATLAALGVKGILLHPDVIGAVNPVHGLRFLVAEGPVAFVVLGSVFLVVTGAEALYADMGHFGKRPIRVTWFVLVLPALLLNYFGQGALLLAAPGTQNPFYELAPAALLYPLVALATMATIIASQAIVSGAFSVTMQAIHLGYSPRLEIRHTSESTRGQIYVPQVNWALMVCTLALVLSFKTSSNLAAAYGVAITTDMVITTILFYVVARRVWGWSRLSTGLLVAGFLVVDLAFLGASALKIPQGGWVPLVIGLGILLLMTTWHTGRRILGARLHKERVSFEAFVARIAENPPVRVPGTAVFMAGDPTIAPAALVHNLKHNKVLHEQVVLLSIRTLEVSRVPEEERMTMEDLGGGFHRVIASYGFVEDPGVADVMRLAGQKGLDYDPADVTYFLGRERIIAVKEPGGMALWREKLFAFMARNAQQATDFFRLPPERVVEVGSQVKL